MSLTCGEVPYWALGANLNNVVTVHKCNCHPTKTYAVGPSKTEDIKKERVMLAYCTGCGSAWYITEDEYRKARNLVGDDLKNVVASNVNDNTNSMTRVTEYTVSEPPETDYVLQVKRFSTKFGRLWAIVMAFSHYHVYDHKKLMWRRISERNYRNNILPDKFIRNCTFDYNVNAILQAHLLGPGVESFLGMRKE